MICIFYMNTNHILYILNLHVGKISKTKLQKKETIPTTQSSILKNEKDSTTWMKATLAIYSIKQQQNKLCKKTHHKKLDNLVIYKRINDGTRKNPNETITHLSDIELNDD